jgi:hypothetical protein
MGRERMSRICIWVAVAGWGLSFALPGCYRASPPDVPEFRAPPKKMAPAAAAPEPVETKPQPVAQEAPVQPQPPPQPMQPPTTPPPAVAPAAGPKPEAAGKPTLVGTWRVTQMAHGGQPEELPQGMQMTLTFTESGALTMTVSGGPVPEAQTTQGSYTFSGSQITMTMEGESKTGTCTFSGPDQVTIEIDDGRMVLRRA